MNETKRNTAIVATIADGALTLTFAHGETLTLTPSSLTPEMQQYAMLHGLKAKLVDAAAISRNTETGRAASIADKYDAVRTVYDRLHTGQWNAPRESGGGTGGGLLLQALIRLYAGRKSPDELRAYLAGKSDAEKAALRKIPKIAAIIATIRAEQSRDSGVDTDALLGELE